MKYNRLKFKHRLQTGTMDNAEIYYKDGECRCRWNTGQDQSIEEEFVKRKIEVGDYILIGGRSRRMMRKLKPIKKELMNIETSTGIIEIPNNGFEFNAENFKYDTTTYPNWAQKLSRIYPAFKMLSQRDNWLVLIQSDEYYGQPEYKIVDKQENDGLFPVNSIHRDDLRASTYNGDLVSDEQMREIVENMARNYLDKGLVDDLEYWCNELDIPRLEEQQDEEEELYPVRREENKQVKEDTESDLPFSDPPKDRETGLRAQIQQQNKYSAVTKEKFESLVKEVSDFSEYYGEDIKKSS